MTQVVLGKKNYQKKMSYFHYTDFEKLKIRWWKNFEEKKSRRTIFVVFDNLSHSYYCQYLVTNLSLKKCTYIYRLKVYFQKKWVAGLGGKILKLSVRFRTCRNLDLNLGFHGHRRWWVRRYHGLWYRGLTRLGIRMKNPF